MRTHTHTHSTEMWKMGHEIDHITDAFYSMIAETGAEVILFGLVWERGHL